MTYTAQAYFLGKYRPLYVTAATPSQALESLADKIQHGPAELLERFQSVSAETKARAKGHYTSISVEWGSYGVSWQEGEHWPVLQEIVADLPPCPGVVY
jgi:hypothetical protein